MLSKLGLFKINPNVKPTELTVNDVTDNPNQIKLVELEAAQLPRSLEDTTASVINAGYAHSAGLAQDLVIAKEDNTSPYVNIIAARAEDKDNPTYKKFVQIFQSQPVKDYILKECKGDLEPAF